MRTSWGDVTERGGALVHMCIGNCFLAFYYMVCLFISLLLLVKLNSLQAAVTHRYPRLQDI